jgi:hypothetical protein
MKFFVCLLLAGLAPAATLPDAIGTWHRTTTAQPALQDQAIWTELGLKDSETATYESGAAKFQASVYRLPDTTASLAAFDWLRPANATPSKLAPLASQTPTSLLAVHGNYVLLFDGHKPTAEELAQMTGQLQKVDHTALPPLHLPSANQVANSGRYILGPAALQKFSPQIPASAAGLNQGAEAEMAIFHSPKGEVPVLVFNYPTWAIARERAASFEKLPGIMVKKSGPLVSVSQSPVDPALANKVLSQVLFKSDVAFQEHVPTLKDNIGNLVINAFILIGILLCFALVSGLLVGGVRAWMRRGSGNPDADTLTTLHL